MLRKKLNLQLNKIMKTNSWRLSSDLVAYFPTGMNGNSKKSVYLASPEKKLYKAAVQKNIESSSFSEIMIDINEFKLKIGETLDIYVKHSCFPDPEQYYLVENFHKTVLGFPVIGNIITQVSNNKGDFGDTIFEAVFSESCMGDVYFLTPEMSEYKCAFEEMKRRMNCTLNKKVKKWIPGNRYDTLTTTYYFLGEFKSRKKDELNSDFLGDSEMVSVYLYSTELDDSKTKISEVFKTGILGKDIYLHYGNLPSAVDSGKVLENDVDNIKIYQEDILKNTISEYTKISEYGYLGYSNLKNIFDIFSVQSDSDLTYQESAIDLASDVIKNTLKETLLLSWDVNVNKTTGLFIGKDNSTVKNVENLIRKYYQDFKDSNGIRNLYYSKLFTKLGINIESIATEIISDINPEELIKQSLENYLSYGSIYFKSHYIDVSRRISKQRINSTNYKLEVVTMDDLFVGYSTLCSDLKTIVENARNSFGIGVKTFVDTNIGTKKSPKIYTTIDVTILDLIKYYGGIDKVPQTIKNEIIDSKFWELSVLIDKDGELK